VSEEPKRLQPTSDVVREIYLRSGNECAFPGCMQRIINSEGTLIGELCHIEGALPGSPRFDPGQSNEQRRAYENLVLMCRVHHKETDNEENSRIRGAASSAEMQRISAFALEMSSLTGTGILLPSGNLRQLAVDLQPPNGPGVQLRGTAADDR